MYILENSSDNYVRLEEDREERRVEIWKREELRSEARKRSGNY